MLIAIVSFIVVFTIVAVVHEFGHFLVAKRSGILVHEFALGFGPRLLSIRRGETDYSINLIPILAYVKIAGEEDETEPACPEDRKYYSKSPLIKFLLSFFGPLFNIILAFLILTLIFLFVGVPKEVSNEIEKISPDSPAAVVGLKSGDKVISIDGKPVIKMAASIDYIHAHPGKVLLLKVSRGDKTLSFSVTPKLDEKLKVGLIGFSPKPIYVKVSPLSSLYYGIQQTFAMVALMFIILFKLVTGGISIRDLAGPVGIAQITGTYAQSGMLNLLHFVAFLNVNIGVINLLPLPALDGGRIVFVLIELIKRKPVDIKLENRINQAGLYVLLALMFLVTINDILRLFRPR